MKKKLLKITITLTLTIIIVLGFAFPLNPAGNWYQQFLPNLNSQQIRDITFLDSLNGFAVTSRNVNPDTSSILRTTNGGDTWQIVFTESPKRFSKIQFINAATGFVCGGSGGGTAQLYKTTNGGLNWNLISSFGCAFLDDMFVLNNDTIWLAEATNPCGGVFRTTNGGGNWESQLNLGSQNPDHIYMYNARIGFVGKYGGSYLRKTTDGGANWTVVESGGFNGFYDMWFTDSLTGWRSISFMKKTTDGGLSWTTQTLPSGGIILSSGIFEFSKFSKDTIYGVGGEVFYGAGQFRGIIYRTTNGGNNWLFQVPDTIIHSATYRNIHFVNSRIGWAYWPSGGAHTINGGDTQWLTALEQISSEVPKKYKLYQNYPNPFNPATIIKYQLVKSGKIKLIIYDIQGKQIKELINQKQPAGTYQVDWNASGYSSGIYFYSLFADGLLIDTKKMVLIK